MKANQTVGYVIDTDAGTIEFTVKGHKPFTLDMAKVHESNRRYASFVGMAQVRIVDGAAIGRNAKDGSIIPEDERCAMKDARMRTLVAHYETGTADWEIKRAARTPVVDSLDDIRLAVARATRATVEAVEAQLVKRVREHGGDIEAQLRYLAGAKSVRLALAELKAERAPQRVDADEALAGFMEEDS